MPRSKKIGYQSKKKKTPKIRKGGKKKKNRKRTRRHWGKKKRLKRKARLLFERLRENNPRNANAANKKRECFAEGARGPNDSSDMPLIQQGPEANSDEPLTSREANLDPWNANLRDRAAERGKKFQCTLEKVGFQLSSGKKLLFRQGTRNGEAAREEGSLG